MGPVGCMVEVGAEPPSSDRVILMSDHAIGPSFPLRANDHHSLASHPLLPLSPLLLVTMTTPRPATLLHVPKGSCIITYIISVDKK